MGKITLNEALKKASVKNDLQMFLGLDAQSELGGMTPERLAAVAGEKMGSLRAIDIPAYEGWRKIFNMPENSIVSFIYSGNSYVDHTPCVFIGAMCCHKNRQLVSITQLTGAKTPEDEYNPSVKYKVSANNVSVWVKSHHLDSKLYILSGKEYTTPMTVEEPPLDAEFVK